MSFEQDREAYRGHLTQVANEMADPSGVIRERHVELKSGRGQSADTVRFTGRTLTTGEFVLQGMGRYDAEHLG